MVWGEAALLLRDFVYWRTDTEINMFLLSLYIYR